MFHPFCLILSKYCTIFTFKTLAVVLLLFPIHSSLLAAGQDNSNSFLPSIVVKVSLSTQTMKVYQNGVATFEWPVSTARPANQLPRVFGRLSGCHGIINQVATIMLRCHIQFFMMAILPFTEPIKSIALVHLPQPDASAYILTMRLYYSH